jgi:hypothetical protein
MRYIPASLRKALLHGLAVAALLQCPDGATTERTDMPNRHPISTADQAIAQASRLTGLQTLTDKITAHPVTISDERTPYIWKEYNGRQGWHVEMAEVALRFKSALPSATDRYQRKFVVLLDAGTGHLVSVVSHYDGKDPDLRDQPSGAAAEMQLGAEDEIYYGLPDQAPRLTFLQALETVLNKGIGSPFLAKEIYGNYVLHSRAGSPQRRVWVITLRGLPPIPARGEHGNSVPAWQRNHMRNVVDDETGTNLFATNSPQPE